MNLQPVIADNVEVGASWRRDRWNLQASYFWSGSDLGSRIQVVGGAGTVRRERTEIAGFELAASYDFASGARIGGNYAALGGRYDSDPGETGRSTLAVSTCWTSTTRPTSRRPAPS